MIGFGRCMHEGAEARAGIVEALALMAAYDGQPTANELAFLAEVAGHLGVVVDVEAVAAQAAAYRVAAGEGVVVRAKAGAGQAARSAGAVGRRAGARMARAGTAAGAAAQGVLKEIGRRRRGGQDVADDRSDEREGPVV